MGNEGLIIGIVFSGFVNIMIIGFFLATGMGKDAWTRWRNKQKYKKGGYCYSLMFSKSGNLKEVFGKVSEGTFKYNDLPYIRNPRLLTQYRGLPAYLHKEDQPEPMNIWDKSMESTLLSANEMDTVMNSQANFDFKEWASKMLPFLLIGAVVVIAAMGLCAYFGYSSFQMLRDGTFQAVEIAASNIVPSQI